MASLTALLLAAWAAAAPVDGFSVLSYNVGGIPVIHPRVAERMRAIAPLLGEYDVVGLQEAWRDKDSEALWRGSGLSDYARYQRDVAIGTGLSILSRFPIIEKRQRRFSLRPSALRVYQGEWPANKGVLMVRLQTPKGRVDVYDTHLIADYENARYRTIRLAQVFELAEFVRETSGDAPFVLLGDLNAAPGDRAFELLKDLLGARDVCRGRVCEDPMHERRIDHVLLPEGRVPLEPRVTFTEPIPGSRPPLAYSDHAGISARVGWQALKLRSKPDARLRRAALEDIGEALALMSARMAERRRARSWIPLYGLLLSLRYDKQNAHLTEVRDRVESARLKAR